MPGGPVRTTVGSAATAALKGAAPELREKLRRRLSRCHEGDCGGVSAVDRPGRWRHLRRDQSETLSFKRGLPSSVDIHDDAGQDDCDSLTRGIASNDDSASSDSDGEPLDYLMLEVASRMPQEDAAVLLEKLQRHEQRHARTKQRLREHLSSQQPRPEERSTVGVEPASVSTVSVEPTSGRAPALKALAFLGIAMFISGALQSQRSWRWFPGLNNEWGDAYLEIPKRNAELNSSSEWMARMMRAWPADADNHADGMASLAAEAATYIANDAASLTLTSGEGAFAAQPKGISPAPVESDVARRARERAAELALSHAVQQQVRRATEAAAERLAAQEAKQRGVSSATPVFAPQKPAQAAQGAAEDAQARRAVLRERVQALEAGTQDQP